MSDGILLIRNIEEMAAFDLRKSLVALSKPSDQS
jgi:hypothetical protein